MVCLRVRGMAVGVDADVRLRELERPAFRALPADEPEHHLAVPVQRGQAGLAVRLRPQSVLQGDQVVDAEVAVVVGVGAAALQVSRDPPLRPCLRQRVRGLEHERVAPLPETDDENPLARRRVLQRVGEHHQRMGRPRLAARSLEVVAHAALGQAEPLRDARSGPAHGGGEAEVVDGAGVEPGGAERAADRFRDDLQEALVAHPALFPYVVETLVLPAVVVDEVGGERRVPEQLRDAVAFPDEQRGGRIAGRELERARGLRPALLGARHQHRPAAAAGDLAGRDQRRCPGSLRPGDVQGPHRAGDVEGFGHDPCVLSVLERQRGRGEENLRDPVPPAMREAVARGLDRHRDRVLVPAGDRALAPAERLEGGVEPCVGSGDRRALQAQPRNIAAEGVDAGAHRPALACHRRAAPDVSTPGRCTARRRCGRSAGIAPLIPDPN